jgi:hypothetical protein
MDEDPHELVYAAWDAAVDFSPDEDFALPTFKRFDDLHDVWRFKACVTFPDVFIAAHRMVDEGAEYKPADSRCHMTGDNVMVNSATAVLSTFADTLPSIAFFTLVELSLHRDGVKSHRPTRLVSRDFGVRSTYIRSAFEALSGSAPYASNFPDLIERGYMSADGDRLFPKEKRVEWIVEV